MDCKICDNDLDVAWTDTHGVAQCKTCGAPYRILHYENDKHVDKPPSYVLDEVDTERIRRFHAETKGKLSAVGMCMSVPGGYDVARQSDLDLWVEWAEKDRES